MTCSGVIFNLYFMCMSDVAMNVWTYFKSHLMAASMSFFSSVGSPGETMIPDGLSLATL